MKAKVKLIVKYYDCLAEKKEKKRRMERDGIA